MTSPIRLELLTLAEAEQPCSIADLARLSGRRATALYRHVKVLVSAGLLRIDGKRPGKRRPEQLFSLSDAASQPRFDPATGQGVQEYVRLQHAALRMAGRLIRDLFRDRDGRAVKQPDRFHARHDVTWIDDERARRLAKVVEELESIVEDGRTSRRGRPYQLSVIVAPRRTVE